MVAVSGLEVRSEAGDVLVSVPRWQVAPGEHWALLGPNGAGKSTLLSVVGARRHPTLGTADVLGARLGTTDLRELRRHVGVVDQTLRMPAELTVRDVILTGAYGVVQPWHRGYTRADRSRAEELLALVALLAFAERPVGVLSAGERARVRLARALMPEPRLLLLDEPAAALDLAAREELLAATVRLAGAAPGLATVTVAHHLEELPPVTTHALLLRAGEVVATGRAKEVLASGPVSAAFGIPVEVRRTDGRWSAVARPVRDGT